MLLWGLTGVRRLDLGNNAKWYVVIGRLSESWSLTSTLQVDSDDSDSDVAPANRRNVKRRRVETSRPRKFMPPSLSAGRLTPWSISNAMG